MRAGAGPPSWEKQVLGWWGFNMSRFRGFRGVQDELAWSQGVQPRCSEGLGEPPEPPTCFSLGCASEGREPRPSGRGDLGAEVLPDERHVGLRARPRGADRALDRELGPPR